MMRTLLYVFASLLCMVCAVDYWPEGSGPDEQIEPTGFCVEIIAYRLNQFYIYWVQPDIDDIEYYEVSYNVSVRYHTAMGERIFRSGNMTMVQGAEPIARGIPLYTENSTYTIRVVAVTARGERVTSNDTIIPEERFRRDHMGRDDAITFFQLGLDSVEPDAMKCSEYEGVYESTLSLIRSQVSYTIWRSCNEVSNNNCNVTLESDNFSCHSNKRLVYTARIVATDTVNATTFLRYLRVADTINVSLHNGTSFTNAATSKSCSLSIPSPGEANCTTLSSVDQPTTGIQNENDTPSNHDNSGSDKNDDDEEEDSVATVIAVAIGCSVGIVAMACFVMFMMFVCNRCGHYDGNNSSSDVEKGNYFAGSSYTISNQDNHHRKTPPSSLSVNNFPHNWSTTLHSSVSDEHHHDNDSASIKSHDHYRTNHNHS